jgi:hypothetical protein
VNAFKQSPFTKCEANHRASPVIAPGNAALDRVWHPRIGNTRTMEQRAIDRWENEGGEIPNEQRKRTRFGKGKSLSPFTFHYISKVIST